MFFYYFKHSERDKVIIPLTIHLLLVGRTDSYIETKKKSNRTNKTIGV